MDNLATPTTYTVLQFKKGTFQDQNGNYWCDMALQGISEPVRIVVKDPMQYHDGMDLYGHITNETSKAGKPYMRFRKDRKDEYQGGSASTGNFGGKTSSYQPRDDMAIRAQWAIGQAVQIALGIGIKEAELAASGIETMAKGLFAMVDRVKDSNPPQPTATHSEPEAAPAKEPDAYNPKRPWENRKPEPEITHEFSAADMGFEGEQVNLDDIPY